ncbi:hypothetical protein, partial [Pelagicoccus mobilis]|uniref:hypothetical protein n=1 Tax=Pelagicoccus mobilis TaxID=415221 RepID=UPI001F1F92AC
PLLTKDVGEKEISPQSDYGPNPSDPRTDTQAIQRCDFRRICNQLESIRTSCIPYSEYNERIPTTREPRCSRCITESQGMWSYEPGTSGLKAANLPGAFKVFAGTSWHEKDLTERTVTIEE